MPLYNPTIGNTVVDAKGDLIVGTADNAASRLAVGASGRTLMADSAAATGVSWIADERGDSLTVGEFIPPRRWATANTVAVGVSGVMALSYFVADKTESISTVTTYTGSVAAGATPTLCRLGVYTVAANGDLTALVASTANDTALWANTTTAYPKALQASFSKVAGVRYAMAQLVVTGATVPQFQGVQFGATSTMNALMSVDPAIISSLAGQTDLPASVSAASLASVRVGVLFRLS